MNWRPGDPRDPENCPVCGCNPDNCDHPTIRRPPKPKAGKETSDE